MKGLNKVRLKDYKEPEYLIPEIFLDISIMEKEVKIISRYSIKSNNKNQTIRLHGIDLKQTFWILPLLFDKIYEFLLLPKLIFLK